MDEKSNDAGGKVAYRSLPKSIWALGLVSMFMDTSSELVHSLLPVFLVTILGVPVATVGVIEGIAEAIASVTKVFSGAISDYLGRRKALVVFGYGLAALTKPVFPLARTIGWVMTARFVDRIGKGIRDAPRDALVADLVQPGFRGAAYGLRQALDSAGALLGPLLAVGFMAWLANDIRAVLWVAVVPAFLAVFLLIFGVHETEGLPHPRTRNRFNFTDVKLLTLRYWLVVTVGAVFNLARFSEAFLILRAQGVGLATGYVPLIMVVMNVVYAGCAYPAGVAGDRFSPRILLVYGLGVLIAADVVLAVATSPAVAFIGAGLWGLHMALTQGLFSKLIANTAPAELRGTAFGIFNLISGGALLLASPSAGVLWSAVGAFATFIAGAGFALSAVIGLLLYRPDSRSTKPTAMR